jgi:hypothetical protein
MDFSVTTNPTQSQTGLVAGAGGYEVKSRRLAERQTFPIAAKADRTALYAQIANSPGSTRLASVETMIAAINKISSGYSNPTTMPTDQASLIQDLAMHIHQRLDDQAPSVRAWATFLYSTLQPAEQRGETLKGMVNSADWQQRLLALIGSEVAADGGQVVAQVLSRDSNPMVADYAKARLEVIAAAATRPSAEPTSRPMNLTPSSPTGIEGLIH